MVGDEKTENSKGKNRKISFEIDDFGISIYDDNKNKLLSSDQKILSDLYKVETNYAISIFCVERHQRTKVGYLKPSDNACEWGESRENATTCGNCPFGVKLFESVPKYNSKTILNNLQKEQSYNDQMYR